MTLKTHLIGEFDTSHSIPDKPKNNLRILHTSDWHLGKMLYNQARYDEFEKFLAWLHDQIKALSVDVLIVAGDIFDTMTPSNRAEHLYHEFLAKTYRTNLSHVIIVAGNHDSPTNLQKTKDVLGMLNTHVIGTPSHDPSDNVIVLNNDKQEPIAIIIAVPYLRDRDVRSSGDNQSDIDRNKQLLAGVANHYDTLTKIAIEKQQHISKTYQKAIPIIATGHLYTAGSSPSSDDDGMRSLQIGTLGQINGTIFDSTIDYVALGHIHRAQMVANRENIRYCGSPIAMGFGEIGRAKECLVIDFQEKNHKIDSQAYQLPIPVFENLARISGDFDEISDAINQLKSLDANIYLEIEYTGKALLPNLKSDIDKLIENSQLSVLATKIPRIRNRTLKQTQAHINLETLNEMDVFAQRLTTADLSDIEKSELTAAYAEIVRHIHEEDGQNT